jgi:GTP-binding protein
LIEGAHEGHGLGTRFLRHVSRTVLLLHLVDIGGLSGRDPLHDYEAINRELACFDAELAGKPQVVVGNKIDLLASPSERESVRKKFAEQGVHLWLISAATGEGVAELVDEVGYRVRALRRTQAEREAAEAFMADHG